MRQTKRRRTRDAACQTLTYRELRDNDNTTLSTHTKPAGGIHRNQKSNPPPAAVHLAQPRQRHRHQQSCHHVTTASRCGSMFNPPTSPLSCATTVSTASVYRVTDGGGIVHGAIVRGGGEGARRRPPAPRRTGMAAGRGGYEGPGDVFDARAFASREVPEGEAPAATTTTVRQKGRQGDEGLNDSSTNSGEMKGSFVSASGSQGNLVYSPPSKESSPSQHQTHEAKQGLRATPPSRHRQPEIIDNQRVSPQLGQVSVSWGQELTGEEKEATEEGQIEPSAAGMPVASPSYKRGVRSPRVLQIDHNFSSAEYQDVLEEYEKPGRQRGAGGSFVYEPLSEGPDYRKV